MTVTKASNPDARLAEFLLATVLVIVVALAEETVFRGYLILRFKNVAANTSAAVLLSAVIFSLGHGYEGSAGVITVGAWAWSLVSSIYGGRASSLP